MTKSTVTRRHFRYNKFFLAIEILHKDGWGSLWFQIKQVLKQTFLFCGRVDKIAEEELKDGKTRLMMVVPSMEMGGAERCASILLEHLDRTRIKPELVTIFDRKAFYAIPGDIKTYVLENQKSINPPPSSFTLPHELQGFANDLAWLEITAFKLSEIIIKRQPTIVLAQDYYSSFIVLLAKKYISPGTKLIVSAHNSVSGLFSTDKYGELYTFLVQPLFNKADYVITVSRGVSQELKTDFGLLPEKIITLYNPLDLTEALNLAEEKIERPWFTEDVPVILFVGRLASYKGLNYLLKACSIVNKSTRVRCVLIGKGDEMENLKQLAENLGIAEDVVFLGRQQNPFKFMQKAAIFVLPSLTEGLPYVLVEALACGCPIIATDSPGGGPAEILKNGEYGLLIPPGDEKALSDAILRLLRDDELRNRFSGTAIERAKDFDLDKTVKAYEDIILGNQIK